MTAEDEKMFTTKIGESRKRFIIEPRNLSQLRGSDLPDRFHREVDPGRPYILIRE